MTPEVGRQVVQLVQCEIQRTIHQAVDQEAILLGIGVRQRRVATDEVDRGRCDDSRHILKRRLLTPAKIRLALAPWLLVVRSSRRDETRAVAVGAGVAEFARAFLAARGRCSSRDQTNERNTLFQEPPPARSLGIHAPSRDVEFLLWLCLDSNVLA